VEWFARNTAPTGWLKANGAAVSRATYADLFAAIGTVFGVGDGATTFNLPDLRGEFIRGWDDARGVDTGRAFGSAQAHAFFAHSHNMPNSGAVSAGVLGNLGSSQVSGTASSSNTDSVGGTETRPRNVALLACIKY
jgi:phage-related tail fiber protein